MSEQYEIRVRGLLGPLLRTIFQGMTCRLVPCQSTIEGELTEADLRRLLGQLDRSGVEVVQLSRAGG
jgi:hypothetical protein